MKNLLLIILLFICVSTQAQDLRPAPPTAQSLGIFNTNNTYTGTQTFDVLNANGFINVQSYGAVGDGITNDSSAFAQAITYCSSNNKTLYIPEGTYLIKNVALRENIRIVGEGIKSILKCNGASATNIFTADSISKWSVENLKFIGTNTTFTSASDSTSIANNEQNGISITDLSQHFNIGNCYFEGFYGSGIKHVSDDPVNIPDIGGKVYNCSFSKNYAGIYNGEYAEYSVFTNNLINSCVVGIYNLGANNKYNASSIKGCYIGLYVGSATNVGHGSIGGSDLNHNTYAIFSEGNDLGYAVTGNNIMVSNIFLNNCTGFMFSGNLINLCDIKVNAGGYNAFVGNYYDRAQDTSITITSSGKVVSFNNFSKSGYWNPARTSYFYDAPNDRYGFGTQTPSSFFHIKGTTTLEEATTDAGFVINLKRGLDGTVANLINCYNVSSGKYDIILGTNTSKYRDIIFRTDNVDYGMTIKATGKIGINTSAPSTTFEVKGVTTLDSALAGTTMIRGTGTFSTTDLSDTVTIVGASVNDFYVVSPKGTTAEPEQLTVEATATGLIVRRSSGTTSGLTYNYIRIK